MNHRHKTALFKCLDILPKKVGYFLYYQLQNLFSKQTLNTKLKATQQSYNTIYRILEINGVLFNNKNITEVGSGWLPIFPYLMKLNSNANVVNTYDINKHYNLSEIKKLNQLFVEKGEIKNDQFIGKYQLLSGVNYFPNTDLLNANIKDTDLIISRFVLEHIPPVKIVEIHKYFSEQLKSGSYILHLISPSDHRAYSDASLSLVDFLKYNETEWNNIQTKFDYHNRLRLPQYLELLSNDFELMYVEFDYCKKGSSQYDKFKKLKLNKDFIKYSEEELTAGSINILLRVK